MKKITKSIALILAIIMCLSVLPLFVSAATQISTIELTGVKFPKLNEKPDFSCSVPSNKGYKLNYISSIGGSCVWVELDRYPSSFAVVATGKELAPKDKATLPNFNFSMYYTFIAYISADSGYSFADNVTATINGRKVNCFNTANGGITVWFCFQKPVSTTYQINTFKISNIEAPVVQTTASWNCTVPSSCTAVADASGNTGYWSETSTKPTTFAQVQAGTKRYKSGGNFTFNANKFYTYVVTVQTKNVGSYYYCFNDGFSATVNGNAANVYNATCFVATIWYCFGKPSLPKVSSVSVSGVVAPLTGETASWNWSVPGSGNYTAYADSDNDTCYWIETDTPLTFLDDMLDCENHYEHGESFTFDSNKYYTFAAWIKAKPGYELAEDVTAKINDTTAHVGYYGEYIEVWYSFGAPKISIDYIDISNIAEPVIGATGSLSFTIPENANYEKFNYYGESIYWVESRSAPRKWNDLEYDDKYDENNIDELRFASTCHYSFVVELHAKDGYGFASNPAAHMDGYQANVVKISNDYVYVWYCFGTPTYKITEVEIKNVTSPVSGLRPNYNFSVPTGQNYGKYTTDGISGYWVESGTKPATWDDVGKGTCIFSSNTNYTFKADKYYTFVAYVTPGASYFFANYVSATMNGKAGGFYRGQDHGFVWYCFGKPDVGVSSLEISGVKAPVAGAYPSWNFTLAPSAGYVKDNSGYPNASFWAETDLPPANWDDVNYATKYKSTSSFTFNPNKYYTFVACVKPDSGYVFFDTLSGYINTMPAGVCKVPACSFVWYCFGKPIKEVTSVSISNVRTPVVGDECTWDFDIETGKNYSKDANTYGDYGYWAETKIMPTNMAQLSTGKTYYAHQGSFTFKEDMYYTFVANVKPNTDYSFSENLSAKINGFTANVDGSTSFAHVWYCFGKPATGITSIAVTDVTTPTQTGKAWWEYNIPDSANYHINTSWYDGEEYGLWVETAKAPTSYNDVVNGNWYYHDDTLYFSAGKYYTFVAYISPDSGYGFDKDLTATVNGKAAHVVYRAGDNYNGTYNYTCVWYCFGTPTLPTGTIRISNVAAPITDSDLSFDYTVPADSGYTKYTYYDDTVYWVETSTPPLTWSDVRNAQKYHESDSDGFTFDADMYYTFVAAIKPKAGYAFNEGIGATVNDFIAKFVYAQGDDYAWVWYCFGKPTKSISAINISDVKLPVVGEAASWDYTIPTGQHYIKDPNENGANGIWVETDSRPINYEQVMAGTMCHEHENNLVFDANKYYTFVAWVKPETDYAFIYRLTGSINGVSANIKSYSGYTSVWYCFGKPTVDVTSVEISGVVVPKEGSKPNWDFNIPASQGYVKNSNTSDIAYWVETDTAPTKWLDVWGVGARKYSATDNITFKADKYYSFIAVIKPALGYSLADTITGKMNNNTADVEEYENIARVWFCFGKPIPMYTVTITNGTASKSNVPSGIGITITANAAPNGKVFDKWEVKAGGVTLANVNATTTTFTMGSANVIVEATYKDAPVPTHIITVTNGTSSKANASKGETITITANAAPTGKVFDKWVVKAGGVTLANANAATTTFTMPDKAVTVEATYKAAPVQNHGITVKNGTASKASAAKGETITVTANAPSKGYAFVKWVVTSGGTVLANPNSAKTTFAMGDADVKLEATYKFVAYGNVDGEGEGENAITAADARLCLRAAVGLEVYAEGSYEYLACDVDGNPKITASDARLVLRRAVGLDKSFPVEK